MPRTRATPSGIRLTTADAAVVKGMLNRGDRQHDVASYFGVNGGRIADIASGKTFVEVSPAAPANLPPPGPYPVKEIVEARQALDQVFVAIAHAERTLRPFLPKPA